MFGKVGKLLISSMLLNLFAEALVANSKDFNIPVTKKDIRECCIDYQPYYKKYIPEVVEHFCNKYNIVN